MIELFGQNEQPSLTTLFGAEVNQDIEDVAVEYGLPVSAVRQAVVDYAPELLGVSEVFGQDEAAPQKGETFARIFKAISDSVATAAPSIAAAARGPAGVPAVQEKPEFDPSSLILPAGIGILLLILLMKKK